MGKSSNNNNNNNNVVAGKGVGVVNGEPRTYVCTMKNPFGMEMHHYNWLWLSTAHFFGFHGWWMIIAGSVPRTVLVLFFFLGYFAGMGITVGCHRYWAHRTFKATFGLQVLLMWAQTMAAQYPIFKWCRDHRIHHKYTETTADPHNASRGFWFAHMGWLLEPMDPAVQEKEATLDLTDLDNDPVVRFQTKYYWPLLLLCMYIVPIGIFHTVFDSLGMYELICINYSLYIVTLHVTWLVNSAAHLYGSKPYDKGIYASENGLVALLAVGEGWHNFHHIFPQDYKTSELGFYGRNWSALFIDTFAALGMAYDLKTVPPHVVRARVKRTGDVKLHDELTSNKENEEEEECESDDGDEGTRLPPWGWGDPDIPRKHFAITQTLRESKAA